jgi:hypothetical protein
VNTARHTVAAKAATLACLALVVSIVAASSALAAGSPTIGTPPFVTPFAGAGMQASGNTATDQMNSVRGVCGGPSEEYWILPIYQGDKVVLQGTETPPASGICADIFPPGTTNANIAQAVPVVEVPLTQGVTFTASQEGRYILAIGRGAGGSDGPFTCTIDNYTKLLVSFVGLKSKIPASGQIAAQAYAADGRPLNGSWIQFRLYGIWKNDQYKPESSHLLATATPKKGQVSLAYRLPKKLRGKRIGLTITGRVDLSQMYPGAKYQPITSGIRTVRVKKAG